MNVKNECERNKPNGPAMVRHQAGAGPDAAVPHGQREQPVAVHRRAAGEAVEHLFGYIMVSR